MIAICMCKESAGLCLLPTKTWIAAAPWVRWEIPWAPCKWKNSDFTPVYQWAFVVSGAPKFCSLYSGRRWGGKRYVLIPGTAPSAPDNPVIHEWLSPMNLQRLGSSLTGFGAGELWALVNYSCKNSCTVRFSSHPAVADATESQPDPPSGIVIFAPETLGTFLWDFQTSCFVPKWDLFRQVQIPVLMTDHS